MNKFQHDLKLGQAGEDRIAALLCKNYNLTLSGKSTYGTLKDYDMKFTTQKNRSITVEAKTDVYKDDTGNMMIEIKCNGKDSGIRTTKADLWVYYYKNLKHDNVWITSTDKLRKLIASLPTWLNPTSSGDNNGALCFKIPRNEYREWFLVLTLEPEPDQNHQKMVNELFGATKETESGLTIAPNKKGIGKVVFKGKHRDLENPFDGEFITSTIKRLYR
ncbi:MAG TPA: hypothetical protein VF868_15275 [Bacteroidia bacterium]|jgi:hypothetical protein